MISKKKKSFFLGSGLVVASLAFSLTLTSCSNVLGSYVEKTLAKGNGSNFYDTLGTGSLQQIVLDALKSRTGRNEILAYVNGLISISIIEKLQEDQKKGNVYKNDLKNQKEKINKDYNDLVKQYKNDYKDAWALKMQQDVLDQSGGTVESYKFDKLISWANSYLNSKIFENFYIALFNDANQIIKTPTKDAVKSILATNNTNLYKFSDKAINAKTDTIEGKIFSEIQQYIFDNWVKYENPYIVNMSLWKYGTPKQGVSSLYINASDTNTSTDDEGNETTTTNSASYNYPYFANDNGTNNAPSTVQKFDNFVADAKTTANFITDITYGLKEIPIEYTEDKSTLILVKNGSSYSDLVPEFASASSYLYGTLLDTNKGGITNNDTKFQKSLNALVTNPSTPSDVPTGFDDITSEFLSTAEISGFEKQLQLSTSYVNNTLTSSGPLSGNRDKKLYAIDAFKPTDTQLNEFMFIRNSFGVHALSIDGSTYLKTSTDTVNLKKKSADIVMYHYFNNIYGFNTNFSIDLQNEMSTYFNNNISQVLIDFISNNTLNISADFSSFGSNSSTVTDYLKSLVAYYTLEKSSNKEIEYQKKLYANKKNYSTTNYGQTADLNGLGTPYVFSPKTDDSYNFDFTSIALPKIDANKSFIESLDSSLTTMNSSIEKYYNEIKDSISPLTSNFEGFQYSQYLYTNNTIVNRVLLTYGNSSDISNSVKNQILKKALGSKYNYNFSRTLSSTASPKKYEYSSEYKSNFSTNTDLNNGIDQGLSNYFYNKSFTDGEAGRWSSYNMLKDATSTNFDLNALNTYRNRLWSYNAEYVNNNVMSSMNELYSLLVTIDYLLQDDYSEFINYLKDTITISNNAFLVWANSYNFEIEDANNTANPPAAKTIDNLLNVSNIKQNLNNSYSTDYFGISTSIQKNELINNSYTDATYTTNENYYIVSGGKLGFYGLQVANAAAVPTTIGNLIFNDPLSQNVDGTGVLYSYNNKENLINYVNNLSTISAVDTLANNLFKYTGTFKKENVVNQKGLDLKKENFIKNINDVNQIKDNYFKPRNSNVGLETVTNNTKSYLPIIDSENNRIKHGGYVIQLNYSNITDFNTFYSYIKAQLTDDKNTYDVIGNLIVKAAMDSNIQKRAIDKITTSNKINVYDIRLYNELGSTYVKNWKW